MKAIVYKAYGTADRLALQDVPAPVPKGDEVRLNVLATSVNASDVEMLRGQPLYTRAWGVRRPKITILGSDIVGVIDTVGQSVSGFESGDIVFGDAMERWGGFAEQVCLPAADLMHKPSDVDAMTAAALPQAACVAFQGIQTKGCVEPGQRVLINGAGGGAGSFAIQIAKNLGAIVTAVDRGDKAEMMHRIGADHVIDYAQIDVTQQTTSYDLILDFVAVRSVRRYRRILNPGGRYLLVGGPVRLILQALLIGGISSLFSNRKMGVLAARRNKGLPEILQAIRAGQIRPVVDRIYPLSETAAAMAYVGAGNAQGKVVIDVAGTAQHATMAEDR